MIAGIEFTVYRDYSQYLSEENDYEYDKALEVLNEQVKKHVENNELTFLYGRKRVNPILPIEMRNTGNIFDKDDYDGPNWEGIRINCEIDIDPAEFDHHKFKANKLPSDFDPKCYAW